MITSPAGNNSTNTAGGCSCSNYVGGVAETIFEEEEEEETDEIYEDDDEGQELLMLKKKQQQRQQCYSISSPTYYSSPSSFSNASTPDLLSTLRAWTLTRRRKPDVKIYVQGECFHLHKDVITSKSAYLKRHLTQATETFNLDPNLKITSETFELIAQHFYNFHHILITPFNLAALRTASEILQLNNTDHDDDNCLREKTESYLCLVVLSNKEFLSIVLRSSLVLFPQVEEMVFIPSRCIEALWGLESVGHHERRLLGDGIKGMKPEDLGLVLESMKTRIITTKSHDLLYRLVDLYFEVYTGTMSEEQKSQVCNSIDCRMLSSELLLHAVQNQKMPLRFIIHAMLIEQLNTHRTIFSAMATTTRHGHPPLRQRPQQDHITEAETLGSLLQKDTAKRQAAKLKSTIDDTSSRIQSLEKELSGMRKLLQETEKRSNVLAFDQDRSVSCRFSGKDDEAKNHDDHSDNNKVGKGESGSKSLSFLRFGTKEKKSAGLEDGPTPRMRKSLGQRFIMGLRTAFGVSSSSSGPPSSNNKEESKLEVDGSNFEQKGR